MLDLPKVPELKNQQPLFGLLTVSTAFSLTFLFTSFFFQLYQVDPLHYLFFNLVLCLLGLVNSLLHYLLLRSAQAGELGSRSIRQFGILLVIAYLLFSLVTAGSGWQCFLPGVFNITGLAALGILAAVDFALRIRLFSRQTLYGLIAETNEDSLAERFASQQEVVFEAFQEMKTLRQSGIGFLLIGIVLLSVETWIIPIRLIDSALFCLLLVSCTGLITLANTYAEEHRFFLFGIATPFRFQRIRQIWAYALIPICLIPALLLAGERSILDPRTIAAAIAWLASQIKLGSPLSDSDLAKLNQALTPPQENWSPGSENHPLDFVLTWLPAIIQVAKWLVVSAIIGGIFWFLTKPLFEKGFTLRKSLLWFLNRLIQVILNPVHRLGHFIWSVINFLRIHLRPLDKTGSKSVSIRTYLKHLLAASSDQTAGDKRPRINRRSLVIYSEYLEWAVKHGLDLQLADNPSDIATKTIELFATSINDSEQTNHPEIRQQTVHDITQIRDLLESDLFSKQGWQNQEATVMRQCLTRVRSLDADQV